MKNDEYINNAQELPFSDEELSGDTGEETSEYSDTVLSENPVAYDSDTLDFPTLTNEAEDLQNEDIPEEENAVESDDQTEVNAPDAEEESEETEDATVCDLAKGHPNKEKESKPRRIDSIFDFIELFVFTLAAVFIITSFFFRYSVVDGDSMQNTLQDEQRLLLTNFFYDPKPGDVVVIDDRSLKAPIVKRVIAVEGQTVTFKSNGVWVDGQLLDEDYVFIDEIGYEYSVIPHRELLDNAEKLDLEVGSGYYTLTVPENEIFVMGDHRNVSLDSRMTGTYHEDSVLGKVVLIFYPFDEFGKIE
ncbi:MAG: signal peptidase I [Clostridia bacterium]|nr:signal peptidase I [Clostridia bacterium]